MTDKPKGKVAGLIIAKPVYPKWYDNPYYWSKEIEKVTLSIGL